MKIFFASVLMVVLTSSFKPVGVVENVITCKSKSGNIQLKVNLTDYDMFEDAELILDKSKLTFNSDDNGYVIYDSKNKVLTIYLEAGKNRKIKERLAYLQFWIIPSTLKSIPIDKTNDKYSIHELYKFKARLISSDPRPGKPTETSNIEMEGTLENTL
jgi:hypothetical protein